MRISKIAILSILGFSLTVHQNSMAMAGRPSAPSLFTSAAGVITTSIQSAAPVIGTEIVKASAGEIIKRLVQLYTGEYQLEREKVNIALEKDRLALEKAKQETAVELELLKLKIAQAKETLV